jgi:hypothetical protein
MSAWRHGSAWFAAALLAGSGQAWALSAPDTTEALRTCATISASEQRLACFDRLAASLAPRPQAAARATPAAPQAATAVAPAVAAAAASADPVDRFGFGEGRLQRAAAAQEAPKPRLEALTARITAARRMGNGAWRIQLDNGQLWRQVSPSEQLDPQVGSEVKIKPASLGSYLLVDASRHSARVHREE